MKKRNGKQQESIGYMTQTLPRIDTSLEAKVFNVGFYIPNAPMDVKTFTDYYDDRIALNHRLMPQVTPVAVALLKEMDPSCEMPQPRKGHFGILADGSLIGGYLVSTVLEKSVYGPNGSVAETINMIEDAIANSEMEHGVVMVCINTDPRYAPDHYFIMEPQETRLQQVTLEDYLQRSNPWRSNEATKTH